MRILGLIILFDILDLRPEVIPIIVRFIHIPGGDTRTSDLALAKKLRFIHSQMSCVGFWTCFVLD